MAQDSAPPLVSFVNLPTLLGDHSASFDEHFWQKMCDLRVAVPAIVVSWDEDTQTVTVQPAIQENILRNGVVLPQNLPQLPNVVLWMFRSGGFNITTVPKAGDEGLVVFADMCIDGWWQQGVPSVPVSTTPQQPAMPNQVERRRHDLSDGFFLPGGWSQPRRLDNYPDEGTLQVASDDGTKVISITGSQVKIAVTSGSVAISVVGGPVNVTCDTLTIDGNLQVNGNLNATGSSVIDGVNIATHTHSGVTTGGSDTGPPV